MKLILTTLTLMALILSPVGLYAEDIQEPQLEEETQTEQTETLNTEDEQIIVGEDSEAPVIEEEKGWYDALTEMLHENIWSNPAVMTPIYSILGGLFIGVIKHNTSNSKKIEGRIKNGIENSAVIAKIMNKLYDVAKENSDIKNENKMLRDMSQKMIDGEKQIVQILGSFIKGTKITVDSKIDIAKKIDEFNKAIELSGIKETEDYKEVEETIMDFKESIKEGNEEDLKVVDSYLERLKAVSNENKK